MAEALTTEEIAENAGLKFVGAGGGAVTGPLPLPTWYDPKNIGNPHFQPNQNRIQAEAYQMSVENRVQKASRDKVRIFRLHVDQQPDFTHPYTTVDPQTGEVTRYLPPFVRDQFPIPEWWQEGINNVVWIDGTFDPTKHDSVVSGRLSVAGAWNDTQRSVEFDMGNANCTTTHGFTIDWHPFTARFDRHFYLARTNNPYGLPRGAHPQAFMDGPDQPFPIITPESLWHPVHNPKGWWQPIVTDKKYINETWEYVNALGVIVLWTKHCNRFTSGANLDPMVMASAMHHNYMRGWLEAEPIWFTKGMSWRTEFFGVVEAEVTFDDDENAQPTFSVLQLFDGFPEQGIPPYHLVIIDGQAASQCVLQTMLQFIHHLELSGRDDVIRKIVYLMDCCSTIVGFEEATEKALQELRDKGVQMTTTKELKLHQLALAA